MKRVSLVLAILAVLVVLSFSVLRQEQHITVNKTQETNNVIELDNPGVKALKHLEVLSNKIGRRGNGSENEKKAADYIIGEFEAIGFENFIQDFTYTLNDGKNYSSKNVIAIKPGKSGKEVIVGAHYDSSEVVGLGADDNASSIGVILEVAEAIKDIKTPYTIRFIAFGSEEVEKQGSEYYVSQMTQEEIGNTIAMINLDSLIAGDKMYVYGGSEEKGWVRNLSLDVAKRLELNLETNPGFNKDYPAGTTGDWSDHAPFEAVGIPYAYFEATNWETGDLNGYTQTESHGAIWHTEKDTLEFIETEFEGRVAERLSTFVQVLANVLVEIKETKRGVDDDIEKSTKAIYSITNGILELDSSYDLSDNEIELHTTLWNKVKSIYPDNILERILLLRIISDGKGGTTGAASALEDTNSSFEFTLDLDDSFDQNNKLTDKDFYHTLIHELFHIISLNDTQLSIVDTQNDNSTFVIDEGICKKDSYLNTFFQEFWTNIYPELKKIEETYDGILTDDYYDETYNFYLKYEDQFVTYYASSNAVEDIAESFTMFVLNHAPTDESIKSKKVNFFYDYPELVELREILRNNLEI
ncbi:M28 family peptidase [Oceanirhabdus sp. W0125-5]|uniref:M28 family peptidase n=1 Tax=Oceanirhabdus sp. W0125-5 TaxID=2999116 RepID=UPI0022F3429F|nr:M20/M25/M40 family metallo-hydrolase [Oceanirhabdus sp. W0125-5]WBW97204.1 M20/M25/M40 family metallo-hydrolase [Oceanirhabdus sp. W0125-5]